jgi:hypothetical protein
MAAVKVPAPGDERPFGGVDALETKLCNMTETIISRTTMVGAILP